MGGATPAISQTPLHRHAMTPMATPLHHTPSTPSRAARTPREAWSTANDDILLESSIPHEKDITHGIFIFAFCEI